MKVKNVSKIMTKILLLTLIIIMSSLVFFNKISNAAASYSYQEGYVWGYSYVSDAPVKMQLTTGSTVFLVQAKNDKIEGHDALSILDQPNVFCTEHGYELSQGYFTVGEEITVSDPALAYILYNGPDMNTYEGYGAHETEKAQNALWYYIKNGGNDNGNLDVRIGNDGGDHNGAWKLYQDALTYKGQVSPTISCSFSSNTVNISVSGTYSRYEVYINGVNKGQITSADISSYTGNVKVNVKVYNTSYVVKYRMLETGAQQKLLVVTHRSTGETLVAEKTDNYQKDTNVSLQKYITHVNNVAVSSSRVNKKANSSTTSQISKLNNSSGTNKIDSVVQIEAGDYVKYNITVYNNSGVNAQKVTIRDTLPSGVTKYSINNGAFNTASTYFDYVINNLGANESRTFTVTVYFGEYKTGVLTNTASIVGCTPTNNSTYRQTDSDYVQMKQYSVRLEKFVTAVTSTNITDTSTGTNISQYYDIINYIKDNNITIDENTIENLYNKWSAKTIQIDTKYDLNNDNKINEEDILIFEACKNITSDNIQSYIKADLNQDGHVDDKDLNIYKIIKANLENDNYLNNYDRYMYILKRMNEANINVFEVMDYARLQKLILSTEKTKENLSADIDQYLKADVNGDGQVNSDDNYEITINKVTINGAEYELTEKESITNLTEENIEILQSYINQYDINNNGKINEDDKTLFLEYYGETNKYEIINQYSFEEIKEIEEIFIRNTTIVPELENVVLDITADGIIDFNDYILMRELWHNPEECEDTACENCIKMNDLIELLEIPSDSDLYNSNLDFNTDSVIDYTDYEILITYINLLERNYLTKEEIEEYKVGITSSVKIESSDSNYDFAYDLNNDGEIGFEDYAEAMTSRAPAGIIDAINSKLTIDNADTRYVDAYDLNGDNKIDYIDYVSLVEYYNNIKSNIDYIIENYSIFDENTDDKDFSQDDINTIKVYRGWKSYNSDYNTDNLYLYDLDGNKIINQADKEIINKDYTNIQSIDGIDQLSLDNIDEFISFLSEEKYNIAKNINIDSIIESYESLGNIITDMAEKENINTILSNNYNISDVSYEYISAQKAITNLDVNGDGLVNNDDISYLGKYSSLVTSINNKEEIENVISSNDINNDGVVDEKDINFSRNLNTIAANSNLEEAILAELGNSSSSSSSSSSSGAVTGREGHPTYNQNGYSKEDNPARVEAGDIVTYTIKLTNTGDNPMKATQIIDNFDYNNNADLEYIDGSIAGKGTISVTKNATGELVIDIANAPTLNAGASTTLTLKFKVTVPKANTNVEQLLKNTAEVTQIKNTKDITVDDSDGTTNNIDSDWVKTKIYKVSLEKYVLQVVNSGRITTYRREGKAEHKYDDKTSTFDYYKRDNVVTVSNGDTVTYTIAVKNDGETKVCITNIVDYLPDGIKYEGTDYTGGQYGAETQTDNAVNLKNTSEIWLNPGDDPISFTIEVEVIEPNISLNILKNVAEITDLKNKNGVEVIDLTQNDNKDADYIQLDYDDDDNGDTPKDIMLSGKVWNDKAWDKTGNYYNGEYDPQENVLQNIKVSLYSSVNDYTTPISSKYTDSNGEYTFSNKDINRFYNENGEYSVINVITANHKKFIKGPKTSSGDNKWTGTYYSYYVVFEYDGITYTSTPDGTTCKLVNSSENYTKDSNAKEDNNLSVLGFASREEFNSKFTVINKDTIEDSTKIQYSTKNEFGFLPESNHIYNSSMAMQSSTNLINLNELITKSSIDSMETVSDVIEYIDLGLRGRDVFDLSLNSIITSSEVTVNGQTTTYPYSADEFSPTVSIRGYEERDGKYYWKEGQVAREDMSNSQLTYDGHEGTQIDQNIRAKDIRNTPYEHTGGTGLGIKVTYKITIKNSSQTVGRANEMIDYFDKKYSFDSAYIMFGEEKVKVENTEDETYYVINEYDGYNSIKININELRTYWLSQGGAIDIYITLTLKDAVSTLEDYLPDGILTTYNMAEITEYQTRKNSEDSSISEYTRGLIDKDSAPGSVATEKVRLTTTESSELQITAGEPTTLDYYFAVTDNLEYFKYEDDTNVMSISYRVMPVETPPPTPPGPDPDPAPDPDPYPDPYYPSEWQKDYNYIYSRVITGTVFEDKTLVDSETRIKTGNGKLDTGEVGVYGAIVKLIEVDSEGNRISTRYTTTTDQEGVFGFVNFLPGYYIIEYTYGGTTESILLYQGDNGINGKSYNGEDFQATNNGLNSTEAVIAEIENEEIETNKISNRTNCWYLDNEDEGISTAIDNTDRRTTVRNNVIGFTYEQMTVLNNMRDMIGRYSADNNGTLVANQKYDRSNSEVINISETTVTNIDDIKKATYMRATTQQMYFSVEKAVKAIKPDEDRRVIEELLESMGNKITVNDRSEINGYIWAEWAIFPDRDTFYDNYTITNMNFGIAEVPVTTIDLDKTVKSFTLTDATGGNTIAGISKDEHGNWIPVGDVLVGNTIDVSVEDEKLQGAKLQITYEVTSNITSEINFDGTTVEIPRITGVVDFIDNNLTYNSSLGDNDRYWEVTTREEMLKEFAENEYNETIKATGTVDVEGKKYTTVVKAKTNNPLLAENGGTATITLEKVLSSTNATLEDIILSTVSFYDYNNIVEITGITEVEDKDRIRTEDRYIILPGVQHDSASAEMITIHPPTGDSSISTIYYIMAMIALLILVAGVFGIKKFIIKK